MKNKLEAIYVENSIDKECIIEMPFIAEYRGEKITTLIHIQDNYKVIISGNEEYGIPTLYDYDTYMGLLSLYLNNNLINGVVELNKENDLRIDFTVNKLAISMGYKTPNNLVRGNIKKSLNTLLNTEVTIYCDSNKGETFKLIEFIDENKKKINKIKLTKFSYNQLLYNYKLFYNRGEFIQIKNRISKRIYNLLLQWEEGNNKLYNIDINHIIDSIPMKEPERRFKKRYIKNALKHLNEAGVADITFKDKNIIGVKFIK